MRWTYAGIRGIRLSHDDAPGPAVTENLLRIRDLLIQHHPEGIEDCVLGYQTLTVFFEPQVLGRERLIDTIEGLDPDLSRQPLPGRDIELPVWYSQESGQDLEAVSEHCKLSVEDLIRLHCSKTYNAYATGFAPGFCYLGDTPERLAIPRLNTPRREVPAGSVALADRQTAVYPSASPGGWRLIGRCPLRLFDVTDSPPGLISVGDRVTFRPIERDQFLAMGGSL